MASPQRLSGITPEAIGVAGYGFTFIHSDGDVQRNSVGFAHGCIAIDLAGTSGSDGVYVNAGDSEASNFVPLGRSLSYPEGVHDIAETIVIERQRATMGAGVRPPYGSVQRSLPGGYLRGSDRYGTVLQFANDITGALIETENYGLPIVGQYWNENNTVGNTSLRASLCLMASDFAVDGGAEFAAYPWGVSGVHGVDHPNRAAGLRAQGSFIGERLLFFQIPGTAVVLKQAQTGQAGAFGIYDSIGCQLHDTKIFVALNGLDVQAGDSWISRVEIVGIAGTGLTVSGSGTVLDMVHVYGADKAVNLTAPVEGYGCYFEAARIGLHLNTGSDGSRFNGINIGPATVWSRAILVQSNGNNLTGIYGAVQNEGVTHTDIAGIEVTSGILHTVIDGTLTLGPNSTSTILILRGTRNTVHLIGGWNAPVGATGTFCKVAENVTRSTVNIEGAGDGGVVLDLSATTLNAVNGQGNVFDIKWDGTPDDNVIYPGGGGSYNLAAGTTIIWNGTTLS